MKMKKYKGAEDGGVAAYSIVPDGIILEFKDKSTYLYDELRPGKQHIDSMKELATVGKGLTSYVNQHVRDNYRKKI